MVDIGLGDRVNSLATTLHIRPSGADLQYVQLQTKSFKANRPIIVEPTTSAGVAAYTGALTDALITGTILFTDETVTAIGGYKEIATVNAVTLQLPIKTWKLKLADFGSNVQVWTTTAILENFELNGEAEGGLKFDIALRILTFDVSTDIT